MLCSILLLLYFRICLHFTTCKILLLLLEVLAAVLVVHPSIPWDELLRRSRQNGGELIDGHKMNSVQYCKILVNLVNLTEPICFSISTKTFITVNKLTWATRASAT